MKKMTFKIFQMFLGLVLFLGTFTPEANATHSMGLDLTYECLGNSQYRINLVFYRDCNGIQAPVQPTIYWTSSVDTGSANLQLDNMTEITPTCPGIVGSACNGGNGIYGIEKYVYTGIITLSPNATNVNLSYQICCRNNAITTITNTPQLYVDVLIANASICNNSPVFTNDPVPFACVGQSLHYNHGAVDADGDVLRYSLTACRSNVNTSVPYVSGLSATNPLTTSNGIAIDVNTGAITFTPTIPQVGVLCVLVEEYRNGVKIGQIIRDMQFTVLACTNAAPTLSGINNTTLYSATATVGSSLCFDLYSNDTDAGQNTILAWNAAIAGATFSSAGTPFATGTFCWTPTAADVGTHIFTVNVRDNSCPLVGQNTYTYSIVVSPSTTVVCDSINMNVISTSDLACSIDDGTATITASNGVAPYTYQLVNWTNNQFYTDTTGYFDNLTAGSYSVWVIDANGCTPACAGSTFIINGNVTPLTATGVSTDVACPSNTNNVADSTNSGGTITITATGGTAPYLYSLDGTNFQYSDVFTNLASGVYCILVLDANGCNQIVTVSVNEPAPIYIDVVTSSPATCGSSNGSITLYARGGDGSYAYYINGQSQSSPTFNGLAAGTYVFSVCDMHYCLYDTVITIGGSPAFRIATSVTNPSCSGDCDGVATVSVRGTNGVSVVWDNGATGLTNANLCAGAYSVVVTDSSGCQVTDSITIVEPDPITVTVSSTTDESCRGNDGAATLTVTGGTPAYAISIANFSAATTLTSSNGVFSNLNAGHYVVNVVDTNGCVESCATHFVLDGCRRTVNPVNPGFTFNRRGSSSISFFQINPNPASTIVQASYQTDQARVGITILGTNGKTVYNKAGLNGSGSLEITIQDWTAGTYFVVLKGQEGKVIKTQKLIIQK